MRDIFLEGDEVRLASGRIGVIDVEIVGPDDEAVPVAFQDGTRMTVSRDEVTDFRIGLVWIQCG